MSQTEERTYGEVLADGLDAMDLIDAELIRLKAENAALRKVCHTFSQALIATTGGAREQVDAVMAEYGVTLGG